MPDTSSILGSAGDIGSILAEYARQRAQGRVAEAGVNQNQAGAEANIFRTRMDAALKGPEQSAHAAAVGDTLANVQPFQWTGDTKQVGNIPVPQATGGLTPANYGPATRQAGRDLATLSASRVNNPAFGLPTPPTILPVPQSGKGDSILGAAGAIGSIAGAANGSGGGGSLDGLIKGIGNMFHRGGSSGGLDVSDPNTFVGPMDPNTSVGPENGTPTNNGPVDPSQLSGGSDPMQEYYDWLASQGADGGSTPPFDPNSVWGDG